MARPIALEAHCVGTRKPSCVLLRTGICWPSPEANNSTALSLHIRGLLELDSPTPTAAHGVHSRGEPCNWHIKTL